jgi:hypothetical protein
VACFEYLQKEPFERFRVPDQSDPITACAALLAFAAFPSAGQMSDRQRASDAFQAWTYRAFMASGRRITPPTSLSRKQLPPAVMRRRVYKASERFECDGLDLVGLGMEMTFFRSDGPSEIARMLGSYFGATSVSLKMPQKVCNDVQFFKAHLATRKSKAAVEREGTLKDFRRRVWKAFLPALPLLTAIDIDCLGYDPHKKIYAATIPGYPRRYLAISLISNPQLWIDSIVMHTAIRRVVMARHFPPDTFAEILGERELPSWIHALAD